MQDQVLDILAVVSSLAALAVVSFSAAVLSPEVSQAGAFSLEVLCTLVPSSLGHTGNTQAEAFSLVVLCTVAV